MTPILWLLTGMCLGVLLLVTQHLSLGILLGSRSGFSSFLFFFLALFRLALAGAVLVLAVHESLLSLALTFSGMTGMRWLGLIWMNQRANHLPREAA